MGRGAEVPSPEAHLGFRPGADEHLAGWASVVDYFRKVDDASDRVAVWVLGRTTEDRPYIVAVVSASETIANLPAYQDSQRRLTDPRLGDGPEDPVAKSKPVVVITCSIHSIETASTLMAMELLHDLAARDDPATRQILDSTILLLVPSANPDGVDKVARWYERSKGHPWVGGGMPELYHDYAGHDTNRDWFMLNLKETRLLTRLLYKEWFPTILYDVHQMGTRGARLFVPPFHDPINPNLDPRISQGIALLGAHMAYDLAAEGKRGVLTHAMYDNWWNGGNRTTPQRHNIVGVLTEAASVKMATPIFLDAEDLRGNQRGFRDHKPAVNFVDPWPGGWWRLRDIVDYELIAARSVLTLAGRYAGFFQRNLWAMGRDAIDRGTKEPPYAWIIPRDQRDPGTAAAMVEILHATGIEVQSARSSFDSGGVTYPAGTWILPAAQPYRGHLKDMMERQDYPKRLTDSGAAEAPYDVAGWTLPLQMGVRAVAAAEPVRAEVERLDRVEPIKGTIDGLSDSPRFLIGNRANDDFLVLNALRSADVPVEVELWPPVSRPTTDQRERVGAFVFPANETSRAVLDRVLPNVSTRVKALAEISNPRAFTTLSKPKRIGLYQPWVPSMDEGWTRLVLEKFGFKYVTLHNAEIRAGDLNERIDVLLIPAIEPKTLRTGYAANATEPAYVGGLESEGADAIRRFVKEGGTLVCLADSCEYAIEELGLPVVNVLKGLPTGQFYGPGSILRIERETAPGFDEPLLTGVPAEVSAYFDRSLAFDLAPKAENTRILMRYARTNPLESGWLLGPEKLQGKGALVETSIGGKGRIILFGFPPQHRGQTHATFRLLFNALL
jgi:hypothetical protein